MAHQNQSFQKIGLSFFALLGRDTQEQSPDRALSPSIADLKIFSKLAKGQHFFSFQWHQCPIFHPASIFVSSEKNTNFLIF